MSTGPCEKTGSDGFCLVAADPHDDVLRYAGADHVPYCRASEVVEQPAREAGSQPKHEKRLGIAVNGPLGPATLDTNKEVELCVPSTTTLP
jgi:hypothetical protein